MSLTQQLTNFLENSYSPYHAVANAAAILKEKGFSFVSLKEAWNLEQGKSYFTTRDDSSLLAWSMPSQTTDAPLRLVGTHTDSPSLMLRPHTEQTTHNTQVLGVETYGGALLYSWLDKSLSLAGRVIFHNKETNLLETKLVYIPDIAIIPSLAIHLSKERGSLTLNPHTHLRPLWHIETDNNKELSPTAFQQFLHTWCKENLGIDDFYSFDLFLTTSTKVALLGYEQQLFCAAHLDNLVSSFLAIHTLENNPTALNMAALFMHEEIGSVSLSGANSDFTESVLQRIYSTNEKRQIALSQSVFLSADGAHALHPNYTETLDLENVPLLGQGVGLKRNARQRYTTNAITAAVIAKLCKDNNIKFQYFVNRSDYPCGSTIGPSLSSRLGIQSADIGISMLGMHSTMETCAVQDIEHYNNLLSHFYSTSSLGI